jgi:hypothetical protein
MTSVTTKSDSSQPQTETNFHLFDNWFDPIEAGLRDRAREFLQAMLEGELDLVLARSHFSRGAKPSSFRTCRGCLWPDRSSSRDRGGRMSAGHGHPRYNLKHPPELAKLLSTGGAPELMKRWQSLGKSSIVRATAFCRRTCETPVTPESRAGAAHGRCAHPDFLCDGAVRFFRVGFHRRFGALARLPAGDLAHVDLAGREQRREQHGGERESVVVVSRGYRGLSCRRSTYLDHF